MAASQPPTLEMAEGRHSGAEGYPFPMERRPSPSSRAPALAGLHQPKMLSRGRARRARIWWSDGYSADRHPSKSGPRSRAASRIL